MDKPDALRLAAELELAVELEAVGSDPWAKYWERCLKAAAELRRLHATVVAREEEIETHSAAVYEATRLLNDARAQRDALLEALKELTPRMPPADAPCHVGLVPQEKCAHCGRIARARAAIAAVEGEAK